MSKKQKVGLAILALIVPGGIPLSIIIYLLKRRTQWQAR